MSWKVLRHIKNLKLPPNGFIDNVPLRLIVSNIGTVSHQLAKYLAKLLPLLAQSNYTINSKKGLIIKIKNKKISTNYEIISFDVKSLFTSVSLEHATDIIIEQIYGN